MKNRVAALERTMQQTQEWVQDIAGLMGTDDLQIGYSALRGVLHTIRDRLPPEEAVHLAAQLPALVRSIYFEGWWPADKPLTYRQREEFLARVQREVPNLSEEDSERAVRAVLTELNTEIDLGQVTSVQECLPERIRELWPSSG